MKAIRISFIAAAIFAFGSCSMEINPLGEENADSQVNPNLVELTLTAVSESEAETKVTFTGYPALGWQMGDAISVLGANTGNQIFTANAEGKSVTFTGTADDRDEVYYGLYPYDKNVTVSAVGVFSGVVVPAVQTATAGTFDPNAYVAIARSEDKEHLYFKGIGTFLKFDISNFAGKVIKSITVMGNNNETMAGTSPATIFNQDGGTDHGGTIINPAKSVKLEGTFDTDERYFMIVRPQPYTNGITVYVELEDGTVLSRSGSAKLFNSGEARNSILTLTLNPAHFTEVTDYYGLYNLGYDIMVGDQIINKSTHSTAVKATSSDPANPVDLYNYMSGKETVVFLSSTNEGTFKIAKNTNITNNVYVLGDKNTTIKFVNGVGVNFKNGTLAFKDVNIDAADVASNQLISNYGAAVDLENLIFDGCKILNLKYPLFAINANYKNYTCKNISLVNTDVQVGGTLTNGIINLTNTASETAIDVDFTNCIFYNATSSTTARIINNNGNLTSYTSSLRFVNNTVFNLHSGVNAGLLHMAGASTVDFQNNLFNFWSLNDTGTSNGNTTFEYAVRIWQNTPNYTVSNNHYYRRDGQTVESDMLASHGNGITTVYAETANAAISTGAYPFTSNVPGAGATR